MPRYDFMIIFEVDAPTREAAGEILTKISYPTGCGIRAVKPENMRHLIGDDRAELEALEFTDP